MYCKHKGHGGSVSVQCEEDWKLTTPQQKVFTTRRKYEACFAVKEKYQWNEIHFKTYQYLFYFSGNSFILCADFCYFRKKELCRVWMKCKKRQDIIWFVFVFLWRSDKLSFCRMYITDFFCWCWYWCKYKFLFKHSWLWFFHCLLTLIMSSDASVQFTQSDFIQQEYYFDKIIILIKPN